MKIKILVASLFVSGVGLAQSKAESFSCVDKSLSDVVILIEKADGAYSLFNYVKGQKVLVDQGLSCSFSNDGKQLFLCSKRLVGTEDFVQYYSEVTVVESLVSPSVSTGFYKLTWEADIKKAKKILTSIYGSAETQCR